MAKGRRSRRVKHQPKPQAKPGKASAPGASAEPGDMADRIEALRGEVREARAEADRRGQPARPQESQSGSPAAQRPASPAGGRPSHRDPISPFTNPPIRGTGPIGERPTLEPPYPRPGGTGRRRVLAVAALSVLVIAGVVAGLLATSSGGGHARRSPIAAYLTGHVPAGTPLAVVGSSQYALPTSYPTVTVSGSSLGSANSLRYVVAPDPVSSAGPAVAAFVQGHATLVAVDRGRASLWALGPPTATPTTAVPATTVAPTTVPATTPTIPAPSTVPATTTPSTAAPTTVAPTLPPVTVPATTLPPTTAPPVTTPKPPSPGAAPATVTVQAGQSFWSIATQVVQQHLGGTPTAAQVSGYWASLVAANAGRLPAPGNPDLIYPGTTLVLPAV